MPRIIIFMDNREVNSGIIEYFYQYDCQIEKKNLVCGDFLVSDRVCIERKTVDDFSNSIIDKRLFSQAKTLRENFERPILIIEGDTLYGRLHPNMIRGALASLVLDWNIPILWTKDPAETAGLVYWIAKREQVDEKREIALRGKKSGQTIPEQQEFLVSGLPDTSIVRARSLLEHFKTPEKVFTATEQELGKVEGIGKKIAKRIRDLLERKYR